jgi:hypothetical protein
VTPLKTGSGDYTARYLVLLGHDATRRALLFARDQRYLAEVIDEDGMLLDNLMKAARACPTPGRVAEHTRASTPATVLCFALDAEHCNE